MRGKPARIASTDRERWAASSGEPGLHGDFVIARKDTPTSYPLAVTVDDHLQGITLVTRGVDVLPSTHVHGLLQKLLGYETPRYAHHELLTDASGRRFAKRDRDMTIRAMRENWMTAESGRTGLRWGAPTPVARS